MKIIALLLVVLLMGCVSVQDYCDQDMEKSLRKQIGELFGTDNYSLSYLNCSVFTYNASGKIDGSSFSYYRENKISSSPAGGFTVCFSTNSDYFYVARSNMCDEISSKNECPPWEPECNQTVFDNTTELRDSCKTGLFDEEYNDRKAFSLYQFTEGVWKAEVTDLDAFC
jgi:hypothetical protein